MKPVVQYYQDVKGEWRWRVKARNGKIISNSGEGYTTPRDARRAYERVVELTNEEKKEEE